MSELVGSGDLGYVGADGNTYKYKCQYSNGAMVLSNNPCSSTFEYGVAGNSGVSSGFGSSKGNDRVAGLGGSQIQRAEVGNRVTFNPLYNKPMYVVSPSMRELRQRKVRSQRPLVQLSPNRK